MGLNSKVSTMDYVAINSNNAGGIQAYKLSKLSRQSCLLRQNPALRRKIKIE